MILIGIALIVIGITIIVWCFATAGMDWGGAFKVMTGQYIGTAFIVAGIIVLALKLIGAEVSIQ